jgi:hypothetical protein
LVQLRLLSLCSRILACWRHSSVRSLRGVGHGGIRRLSKIAVSDGVRLEGLTQFRFSSRRACLQTIGTTGHAESDMREGRFCARLFQTDRKSLILNGEMSEWSIEHAWKSDSFTRNNAQQHPPTQFPPLRTHIDEHRALSNSSTGRERSVHLWRMPAAR